MEESSRLQPGPGTPNPPGDGRGDFLSWRMDGACRAGMQPPQLRSQPARQRPGRWEQNSKGKVRCAAEESGEEKSAEKVPLRSAIHVTDKVINSFG